MQYQYLSVFHQVARYNRYASLLFTSLVRQKTNTNTLAQGLRFLKHMLSI